MEKEHLIPTAAIEAQTLVKTANYRAKLGTDTRPRHVQQVLAEMVAKRGYPKLRRNAAKLNSKITYEKIL
ncbi:MAG: hypothetical protein EOO98_03945 [Pedobacter sp.]|nr:MAG: hypothetical protein EOO98_03945 [Pedobacter sp.]